MLTPLLRHPAPFSRMRSGPAGWRLVLVCLAACASTFAAEAPPVAATPALGQPLWTAAQPFTYAFLAWEGKATIADGKAIFKGLGTKGGAGGKVGEGDADLTARADQTPVLKLRTAAANTAKALRFRLIDAAGTAGTWNFDLPATGADATLVIASGSLPLSQPAAIEGKKQADGATPTTLDLAHITGWQFIGDWQPGVLDVEIEAAYAIPADARMKAERVVALQAKADETQRLAKQEAEEVARRTAERENQKQLYGTPNPGSPVVVETSVVAPDIIALVIEAQHLVQPVFSVYEPQVGDVKKLEKERSDRTSPMATLIRGDKRIGWLLGKDLAHLETFPSIAGDPLLDFLAEDAAGYAITSSDDPAYAQAIHPAAIFRKSMPTDWLMGENRFPMRHRIYLKLATALTPGKSYAIAVSELNLRERTIRFIYDPRKLHSEAIHSNQIGFRADDPEKLSFLSVWLGTGGALRYPDGLRFSVIDEATGQDAFTGPVELALAADGRENLGGGDIPNSSRTAIYRMDFTGLTTPGRYRVHVAGIGCGYPFEISPTVWEKAFLIQMRGLYHQRSGIELGTPYTSFKRPRDFHPADGAALTRTTYDPMTKGMHAYQDIADGDTGEPEPNAWGGYHDAGDWNPRRVSHMAVTFAQLELVEMYPTYFNSLKLNIPPEPGVPDIITEALFEIDCFRRLQQPDGGMPFGIETNGDPLPGEISWLSTQRAYVLAPNISDSWYYAAVAGRAAKVLAPLKPELATVYRTSAEQAFAWAEADYVKRKADGSVAKLQEMWRAIDNRNLAALVLFDLTGTAAYHDVFMQGTRFKTPGQAFCTYGESIQCDAAFLYGRLPADRADEVIKKNAIAATVQLADQSRAYAAGNAFNLTHREKYRPLFCGFFSTSGGTELARAHYLTGKPEYLADCVRSCQFQSGCNPNNLVYTTGLGANPIRHPLNVDADNTGQPSPEGITSFGNIDFWRWKGGFWDWPVTYINKPTVCWPDTYSWPLTEAYFDVRMFVSQNEFVMETWTPNVFVWGYLAARGRAP